MFKRVLCLVAAIGLVSTAVADDAKKDLEKMQGEWKVEKATRGGMDAPAEVLEKVTLKVEGKTATISEGGARDEKAELTLDPSKKPAAVDLKPMRDGAEVRKGIYKLEGDSLTLCWSKDGTRPTEFASKAGTETIVMVLKRKK